MFNCAIYLIMKCEFVREAITDIWMYVLIMTE